VVRGGRIAVVRRRGPDERPGPDDLDARGGTLLPGLVNCHVHIARAGMFRADEPISIGQMARNLRDTLAAGVTTVGDMGCAAGLARSLRALAAAGPCRGPSVVAVGPLVTAPGGYPFDWLPPSHARLGLAIGCRSEDDARRAVERVAGLGMDAVKLVVMHRGYGGRPLPTMSREVAKALVAEAHRRHMLVLAHAHSVADYKVALDAGADALMHSSFDALDDATLAQVKAAGVPVCPTLWVFESLCPGAEGLWHQDPRYARVVSVAVRREWGQYCEAYGRSGATLPPGIAGGLEKEAAARAAATAARNLARLVGEGVRIAFGSDAPYGFSVLGRPIDELRAMERAGMDRRACLEAATTGSALLLGLGDRGRLEPGMRADFVVVDGDASEDLGCLERVRAVVQEGAVRRPRELERPDLAAPRAAAAARGLGATVLDAIRPPRRAAGV